MSEKTGNTPGKGQDLRSQLRSRVLQSKKRESRILDFFGDEIEIRQTSVSELMDAGNFDDREAIVRVLINQAYVPGTDQKLFEEADLDSLMSMPSGKWISDLTDIIKDLSGVKEEEALKK